MRTEEVAKANIEVRQYGQRVSRPRHQCGRTQMKQMQETLDDCRLVL